MANYIWSIADTPEPCAVDVQVATPPGTPAPVHSGPGPRLPRWLNQLLLATVSGAEPNPLPAPEHLLLVR